MSILNHKQNLNFKKMAPAYPAVIISENTNSSSEIQLIQNKTGNESKVETAWKNISEPMKIIEGELLVDDPEMIYEILYEGKRSITKISNGSVQLVNPNRDGLNNLYELLIQELEIIKDDVIFDGIITLQSRNKNQEKSQQGHIKTGKEILKYYVFDILFVNGYMVTDLPLKQRKKLLATFFKNYHFKNIIEIPYTIQKGRNLLKKAIIQGHKGIIAKTINGLYRPVDKPTTWLFFNSNSINNPNNKQIEEALQENELEFKSGSIKIKCTQPSKLYWTDEQLCKGDLLKYYHKISKIILPYIKNKPLQLQLNPNGITGPNIVLKYAEIKKLPDFVRTVKIYSHTTTKYIDYILCNDAATLLYIINRGCIEISPWQSAFTNREKPDYIVIDLAPSEIDFVNVVNTALLIKELCDEMKISCYCKISGYGGLHIYIPTAVQYTYDEIRPFAQALAAVVHLRLPDYTTLNRSIAKRKNKVYIDFQHNRSADTFAAPYSMCLNAHPIISAPLQWSEVNHQLEPQKFTIDYVLNRIESNVDVWKGVLTKSFDLQTALKKIALLNT